MGIVFLYLYANKNRKVLYPPILKVVQKMKDPAFLFYPSDFLTGTMFMTDEQIGKYIRMLCCQHQNGHLSEEHMLFICKTLDKDILQKFKKDEYGLYYNERLDVEIAKRHKYCESRRNNRKGKTKPKEDKSDTSKTYVETHDKTYVKHMENENININDNNINNSLNNNIYNYDTLFFDFWNRYVPVKCDGRTVNKGSKKLSFEKFVATLKSGVEYETIINGMQTYLEYCRKNNQFSCNVPTFFNQQRWADDYYSPSIDAERTGSERQGTKSFVEIYSEIADSIPEEDGVR